MAPLKLLTWNVRGLRDRIKRTVIFSHLKDVCADIIVLVETHAEGRLLGALRRPWIGWSFHAPYSSYSRGVSLLIAKSVPFRTVEVTSDPQGRYIFVHGEIAGRAILLLACYVPPPHIVPLLLP